MAERLTVADLHRMKAEGKKIAAAVVYEYQITKICERAGVDVLSVGDSLGRNVLGQADVDDCTVDDMIPFARAVVRGRERAIVSVDMPTTPSRGGVKTVVEAAKRFRDEAGVDMVKVDIRTREEQLFDEIPAVIETGLHVYPQIGFPTQGANRGVQGGPEVLEHVMKWAHKIQDAGAAMIDLTNVPPDIYEQICKSLRIPVIGGQAPQQADGKIQVAVSGLGYFAAQIDRDDGRPNMAKYAYDAMKGYIDDIHAGKWGTGQ
ncbi:MAG: 3-methyl-2-oxobutanoate hydroxymethyltransferase [Chloroflexota bacterium]|nr:3-methyl-2-oxobutanoate hydroxymethyltransferase [Chloroflexota bacterium]